MLLGFRRRAMTPRCGSWAIMFRSPRIRAGPTATSRTLLLEVKRTSARHCAIASDCSAINPAPVNSVFLQCEVVAYCLAACAEVARDYRRFVVSRLAPEEPQVSRCEHQRHSHF